MTFSFLIQEACTIDDIGHQLSAASCTFMKRGKYLIVDCKVHETEYVSPTEGAQNRTILDIRVFVLHKIVFC
jgi:hypothetical protein